jgi:putative serine protease PepD
VRVGPEGKNGDVSQYDDQDGHDQPAAPDVERTAPAEDRGSQPRDLDDTQPVQHVEGTGPEDPYLAPPPPGGEAGSPYARPSGPQAGQHGPFAPPGPASAQPGPYGEQGAGPGQNPGRFGPRQQGPGEPRPGHQGPGQWYGRHSSAPQGPGPYGPPYGGPPHEQQHTRAYPVQQYGYPAPYQQQQQRQPQAGSRFPGWVWPVIAAIALIVGALGGVLGGVAVSSSLNADNVNSIPVIGTDNGAAAPLAADNGSVSAVAARLLPSTVQVQAKGGADGSTQGGATGSGFVLDDKDHVITNNHVVADATGKGELKVVDQNGRKHAATIVGRSPVYDIAVLKIAGGHGLRPAAIGSSRKMHVGDTVVAIGSPLGLSSTVTSGIVSALDRPVTTGNNNTSSYINAVQTDAAINPGNSGGPLVNMRGQVVGVNSAIATTGGSFGGESGNIGVGFAIPMEQVRITASQILATGKARYPVIGANVNTGAKQAGANIVDVPSGTPAAAAGLRKGDVVTEVNGKPITDGIGLIVAIRSHQPGETITLTVHRAGSVKHVRVRLDSKQG